jgi:hypothetical protein
MGTQRPGARRVREYERGEYERDRERFRVRVPEEGGAAGSVPGWQGLLPSMVRNYHQPLRRARVPRVQ